MRDLAAAYSGPPRRPPTLRTIGTMLCLCVATVPFTWIVIPGAAWLTQLAWTALCGA